MRLDDRLRVTPSPALFADLKQLLGPGMPDRLSGSRGRPAWVECALVIACPGGRRRRRRVRLGVAVDRTGRRRRSTTSGWPRTRPGCRASSTAPGGTSSWRSAVGLLCGTLAALFLDRVPLLTLAAVVVGSVARHLPDAPHRRGARPARPAGRSRRRPPTGPAFPVQLTVCGAEPVDRHAGRCAGRVWRWCSSALTPRRVARRSTTSSLGRVCPVSSDYPPAGLRRPPGQYLDLGSGGPLGRRPATDGGGRRDAPLVAAAVARRSLPCSASAPGRPGRSSPPGRSPRRRCPTRPSPTRASTSTRAAGRRSTRCGPCKKFPAFEDEIGLDTDDDIRQVDLRRRPRTRRLRRTSTTPTTSSRGSATGSPSRRSTPAATPRTRSSWSR